MENFERCEKCYSQKFYLFKNPNSSKLILVCCECGKENILIQ